MANFVIMHENIHARLRVANIQTLRDIETARAVRAVQGMARALGHFDPHEGVRLLAIADVVQAVGDNDAQAAVQAIGQLVALMCAEAGV